MKMKFVVLGFVSEWVLWILFVAVVVVALGFYLCMCVWVLKEGGAELSGLSDKFGGGVSG
jgi:hypothetical protein